MRDIIAIVEGEAEPYIHAHRSGEVIWIDMMAVPKHQRRAGLGRSFYDRWEAQLPSDVTIIRLMAADTGSGLSNGFWEAMGFDYQYSGEDLDYETSQYMWKGANGHPTPATVHVEPSEDD